MPDQCTEAILVWKYKRPLARIQARKLTALTPKACQSPAISNHKSKSSGRVMAAKVAIITAAQGPDENAFPAIDIKSLSSATSARDA